VQSGRQFQRGLVPAVIWPFPVVCGHSLELRIVLTMNQRFMSLSLGERIRAGFGDPASGEPYKTQRVFFDFVVNGISLYKVAAQSRDLVSVISAEPVVPAEQAQAIERLLARAPGDASNGRVSLYTCAECGDLGCGAITVRINEFSDEIIWRDFGFENNYEPDVQREPFSSLGPFHFDRSEYEAQLQALLPR
jgi:hypothetical protein